MSLEENLATYLGARSPSARYSSFDYCFNYFQEAREKGDLASLASVARIQDSCLQVGFYLASWGMLRGSSILLQRSAKHFEPVVHAITAMPDALWEADVQNYDETADLVLWAAQRLRRSFPDRASDTLVTKLMLGTFGCVPAFDTYFRRGLGTWAFSARSLSRIADFYGENRDAVEAFRVPTLDFTTGRETQRMYPRAKVIDMHFFVEGGS